MSNQQVQGLEGVGGPRSVGGDARPEETPIQPGNFAKYDMDGDGNQMPEESTSMTAMVKFQCLQYVTGFLSAKT